MPTGVHTVVDVIILSYTKNQDLYDMTRKGIDSLNASEHKYKFNIVLVETDREHKWEWPDNVQSVLCDLPFNYNQALNKGSTLLGGAKQVIIANNDVLFTPGWYTNMVVAMQEYNLDSASPLTLGWHCHADYDEDTVCFGFQTSYQFCGWCLVFERLALSTVLPLDESFMFEYQDNDLALQLQQRGYKHALIGNAQVIHLLNQSHHLLTDEERQKMIAQAHEVFDAKYR